VPVSFSSFNPRGIQWQSDFIDYILGADYSKGIYQTLLTGGFGSAKTTPVSWLAIYLALTYPNLRVALCRRTLPDIKSSLYLEIQDQIRGSEEVEQEVSRQSDINATITFSNGSILFPLYWGDGNHDRLKTKVRS